MTEAKQARIKGHELDQKVKNYILSSINSDGYEVKELSSVEEKIKFLYATFMSEYGWHFERFKNRQKSLTEWLMGLPSCLDLVFYNYDIIQLAIKWGSLPENHTEAQAEKILANYWDMMSAKICQLFDGYHLPKEGDNND